MTVILHTISLKAFKDNFLPQQQLSSMFKCAPAAVCSDDMYLDWLRRSSGEVAGYLDLNLHGGPDAVYSHKLDGVWRHDRNSWWLKHVPVRPLLEVVEIKRYLGEFKLHDLPAWWTQEVNHTGGMIQIIPNPGGSTVSGIRSNIMYPIAARHGYTPNEFWATYKAGFVYPLKGQIAVTKGSKVMTVVPDTAGESADTVLNGFAYSCLAVRNPVWVSFNGEVHQVDWCSGSTANLRTFAQATYTGDALVLAYPDSIRGAIMALAAVYVIEHLASRNAGISSGSMGLDALMQTRSYSIGKGFGIYSPLIQRNVDNLQRLLHDAWDTWAPVNMAAS